MRSGNNKRDGVAKSQLLLRDGHGRTSFAAPAATGSAEAVVVEGAAVAALEAAVARTEAAMVATKAAAAAAATEATVGAMFAWLYERDYGCCRLLESAPCTGG